MNSIKGDNVFFLVGAGASADSKMPTYRGGENPMLQADEAPPTSIHFLETPEGKGHLWQHLHQLCEARDNAVVGKTLKRMEQVLHEHDKGMIVTQNVDGLIKRMDLSNAELIELHGNLETCYCMGCKKQYELKKDVYRCEECGAWLRPDIVLMGEHVEMQHFVNIFTWINRNKPSVCYVIGTTLQFDYLHAIILKCRKNGARVVHINTDPNYLWHRYRQKQMVVPGAVEPVVRRLVKRKREDELRTAL